MELITGVIEGLSFSPRLVIDLVEAETTLKTRKALKKMKDEKLAKNSQLAKQAINPSIIEPDKGNN